MGNPKQSLLACLFSIITIGILTFLTYRTEFGIFLLASFGIIFSATIFAVRVRISFISSDKVGIGEICIIVPVFF